MLELTINEKVYGFKFDMGFMRAINKQIGQPVDGLPNVKKNVGLQYYVAGVIDGDVEALVEVLNMANQRQTPRVSRDQLDAYIDDEGTDLDGLFQEVLDFLEQSNATKNTTKTLLDAVAEEKAKRAAAQAEQ